jgi:hypothetical protein
MGTTPLPPAPPAPPAAPRSGSNLLGIVLLSLALIVIVSGIAVWTGVRFLAHNLQVHVGQDSGEGGEVSIKTPFGAIEVNKGKDVSEATLGLPLYPGSTQLQDSDSASVSMGLPGDQSLRIVAAKFRTSDSVGKVTAFYRERLGSEVTRFREKDEGGKTVFEIKHSDLEKVVALKSEGDGTRIELVRVAHGPQSGN